MIEQSTLSKKCFLKGFRSAFLDFVDDPFRVSESDAVRYVADGLLIVESGYIKDFGQYQELKDQYVDLEIIEYPNRLLMPGLIDTHVHYPQIEMIGSYGEQLLEWLSKYTFPTERKFSDKKYARKIANFFLDELLKNGTTTALVFATVFPESVDAFFEAAKERNLRMITGKVMMNRNAPDYLLDKAQQSYQTSKKLIEKWHKNGRLLYAVMPRFAITSTPEQLDLAGQLLKEYPDVYLHTHLSENTDEVISVEMLFPECQGYLDVYDQAGLVTEKSIFAHGVQLSDQEFARLSAAKSAISFCPTANLFLGSGLFRLQQAKSGTMPVKVGLASDVGAGTSLSLLQTANEAYKIAQLQGKSLSSFEALFLATLGGATALSLEDKLGNFAVGKEADFIVLDPQATPTLKLRNQGNLPANTLTQIADITFALMMMGDDRAVEATYIMGEKVGNYRKAKRNER